MVFKVKDTVPVTYNDHPLPVKNWSKVSGLVPGTIVGSCVISCTNASKLSLQ